ncbi:MAG: signal peptide peptidase SppA [Bacteroidales bacterium]|nr:signal peptide peptidase SppA [Bacteroidales bacterium]
MSEKKPLSFGATLLASALGVVAVSVVTGIVMLIVMIGTVASLSKLDKKEAAATKPQSVLDVDLGRIAGDRTPGGLEQSLGDGKTVGLVDACRAIREAAGDARVVALRVTDPGTSTLSWGSLTELRDAIEEFRQSGKPVVSFATMHSQGGYYLCSAADMVCLHPSGMVDFRGMGAQVMYYKDMLDKLGVEMQLIRPESCTYKSAGEVYTMNHMSPDNREQIRAYIGSIWRTATARIAASRGLTVERLNATADALEGCMAGDALRAGLVDTLCFETDVHQLLRERHGGSQLLPLGQYASATKHNPAGTRDRIAVIYAEGNVVDGSSRGFADGVYGDDIVKALRQASDNDRVKAIVLRVNSPGGQATASEAMTNAVRQAREKKPVVVSMGDLAASAGYEISCLADCIVAQPTTVTGSIGVFGTVPSAEKLLGKKLGLNIDTVLTNRNAASMTMTSRLSPAARAMMERNVEDFYRVFLSRVAEGRHMTVDEVHKIARGRVWTGADAVGIGLVDTLGGIDLALRIAAAKAGLESYGVTEYPLEKDTWTQLSELLGGGAADTDLRLADKARLALGVRSLPAPLTQTELDLRYAATSEGLQARLPFVVLGM